jgi:hypothetical protein
MSRSFLSRLLDSAIAVSSHLRYPYAIVSAVLFTVAAIYLVSSDYLSSSPYTRSFIYALNITYVGIVILSIVAPLGKIPSANPLASFTTLWIRWHRRGGAQALGPIGELHARHGPIVKLSPAEVSVASYEGAHKIYIERGGFAKPAWWADEFRTFGVRNLVSFWGGEGWAGGGKGEGFVEESHRKRKRDMGNVYAKTVLLNSTVFRGIAQTVLGWLVTALDGLVDESRDGEEGMDHGVLDVYNFNGAVNADFVSAYLFGTTAGFAARYTLNAASRDEYFSNHGAFLKGDLGKPQTWLEEFAMGKCENLAAAGADKDLEKSADGGNIAEEAIVYNRLTSRGVQGKDLASELLDHFIAGAEAPRTILTYLEWELSKQPAIQNRLRNEVRTLLSVSEMDKIHDSEGRLSVVVPAFKDLDNLPLLDAVLTETLRVYTPTPGPQHRVVPPQGTTIHGQFIPGGTQISACFGVLHRNADVFPSPEKWLPERWLTSNTEELEEMKRWFWAFNKGSRGCIGKDFTLIGTLVQSSFHPVAFARQGVDEHDELMLDFQLTKYIVMKLIIATIYARYETSVVQDFGMKMTDRFLAQPEGESLMLRFRRVV